MFNEQPIRKRCCPEVLPDGERRRQLFEQASSQLQHNGVDAGGFGTRYSTAHGDSAFLEFA
jgi:hypothetical protein